MLEMAGCYPAREVLYFESPVVVNGQDVVIGSRRQRAEKWK